MPALNKAVKYAAMAAATVGSTLVSSRKRGRRHLRELLARFNRMRCGGLVIAVTGSSAKTTTVSLLSHILSGNSQVLTQALGNGLRDATKTLRGMTTDDDYVVVEAGTAGVGQLEKVARLLKPDVAIVTLVALEHYTAFRKLEAVAHEKAAVVRALPSSGLAILNGDDPLALAMSDATTARKTTFGIENGDYRVRNLETSSHGMLTFRLSNRNLDVRLETQLIGTHNWLPIAAAATCALELGCPPEVVAARVRTFSAVFSRLSVHYIDKGPTFILDTAKAPYHSIQLPLDALKTISAPRKRFVLGQISDYPGNPVPPYRNTFRAAKAVADEVIFVGPNAKRARATEADRAEGRFKSFADVEGLAEYIKATAIEGEVILLKSSQNMHIERVWLNSVGPVRCWPNECGFDLTCIHCGHFNTPFPEHPLKKTPINVGPYRQRPGGEQQ